MMRTDEAMTRAADDNMRAADDLKTVSYYLPQFKSKAVARFWVEP